MANEWLISGSVQPIASILSYCAPQHGHVDDAEPGQQEAAACNGRTNAWANGPSTNVGWRDDGSWHDAWRAK